MMPSEQELLYLIPMQLENLTGILLHQAVRDAKDPKDLVTIQNFMDVYEKIKKVYDEIERHKGGLMNEGEET